MNSNLDSTSTKSSWVVVQVLFFDHSFFLIIKVTPKNTNQQEALRFSTAPSKKIARNPDRNGWVKVKPAGFAGRSRILRCIHSYSLYRFLFCIYTLSLDTCRILGVRCYTSGISTFCQKHRVCGRNLGFLVNLNIMVILM